MGRYRFGGRYARIVPLLKFLIQRVVSTFQTHHYPPLHQVIPIGCGPAITLMEISISYGKRILTAHGHHNDTLIILYIIFSSTQIRRSTPKHLRHRLTSDYFNIYI